MSAEREIFRDNAAKQRFELEAPGGLAIADYRPFAGGLALPHVETDPALRGSGISGRLMQAIADHARSTGLKLKPVCPYAIAWFQKHPDQRDLLV